MRTSMPSNASQSAGWAASTVGAMRPVPRDWITGAYNAVRVSSPPALRSPTMPRTRMRSPGVRRGTGAPSSKATKSASDVVVSPSSVSCTNTPPRSANAAVTTPSTVTACPSNGLRGPSPCTSPIGTTRSFGVAAPAGRANVASKASVSNEREDVIVGGPGKRGGKGKRNA